MVFKWRSMTFGDGLDAPSTRFQWPLIGVPDRLNQALGEDRGPFGTPGKVTELRLGRPAQWRQRSHRPRISSVAEVALKPFCRLARLTRP